MPDEQDQVTVAFENHDFALTPSPGEVTLPVYGRKIHHDPRCGHLTDADGLPRFPDPDRLLWRRLIDSAPSHDTAARAEFARFIGLLGGSGQTAPHQRLQLRSAPCFPASGRHDATVAAGRSGPRLRQGEFHGRTACHGSGCRGSTP